MLLWELYQLRHPLLHLPARHSAACTMQRSVCRSLTGHLPIPAHHRHPQCRAVLRPALLSSDSAAPRADCCNNKSFMHCCQNCHVRPVLRTLLADHKGNQTPASPFLKKPCAHLLGQSKSSQFKANMEALIKHFKISSRGFALHAGETSSATEAPKGEFGVLCVSDGGHRSSRSLLGVT